MHFLNLCQPEFKQQQPDDNDNRVDILAVRHEVNTVRQSLLVVSNHQWCTHRVHLSLFCCSCSSVLNMAHSLSATAWFRMWWRQVSVKLKAWQFLVSRLLVILSAIYPTTWHWLGTCLFLSWLFHLIILFSHVSSRFIDMMMSAGHFGSLVQTELCQQILDGLLWNSIATL